MCKVIGKMILMIIGSSIAGVILLSAVFCLPVDEKHYTESMKTLEAEGWYPAVPVLSASLDTHFHSLLPGVLDGSTDRIMITTALDSNTEENVFKRAMNMYSSAINKNYSYYWHGYVSILRPVLLCMNYEEFRVINGIIQTALIFLLMIAIIDRFGKIHGGIAFISYILMMPVAVGLSLQFTWVFYISVIGCLIVVKKETFWKQNSRILYLFTGLGIMTSFFDLLTYPLVSWGLPVAWWIVEKEGNSRSKLLEVIKTGLSWIAGYGGMWALKWIMGNLILKRNIWETAINEIFIRSGTESEKAWTLLDRWHACYINYQHYSYYIFMLVLIAVLGWIGINSLRKGWCKCGDNAALLLIGISPIVWYLALAEHTSTHHFFTYRIYGISVLAFLLMAVGNINWNGKVQLPRLFKCGIIWCGIGMIATALTLLSREEMFVLNGEYDYSLVEVTEDNPVRFSFTPTYSAITEYYLGLKTNTDEGIYKLLLYKEEMLLEQIEFPMSEVKNRQFYPVKPDWRLRSGETYEIELTASGHDSEAFVMITNPDVMPLAEYSNVRVGGNEIGGQPISGICYKRLPGKYNLIFVEMTWIAVTLMCYWCMKDLVLIWKQKGRLSNNG